MMQEKRPVSVATISRIKSEMKEEENPTPKKLIREKKVQKKKHVFKKLSTAALRKIDDWTQKENAPTQEWMATKLGVTSRNIRYHIKNSLGKKLKKKKESTYNLQDRSRTSPEAVFQFVSSPM